MANRQLSPAELQEANALLADLRERLKVLSGGDPDLLFAYRRKVAKQLTYDERSPPMLRRKLKAQMRQLQDDRCARCGEVLPEKYAVLDRFVAAAGYVVGNVRLICEPCDREVQKERAYT